MKGFNLLKAFSYIDSSLEYFGGHEMAAGFKIKRSKLKRVIDLIKFYAEKKVKISKAKKRLQYECEVKIKEIRPSLINFLKVIEPFGIKNTEPVFIAKNIKIKGVPEIFFRNSTNIL